MLSFEEIQRREQKAKELKNFLIDVIYTLQKKGIKANKDYICREAGLDYPTLHNAIWGTFNKPWYRVNPVSDELREKYYNKIKTMFEKKLKELEK